MLLVFHVDLRTTQLAAIKSIWSPKCITLHERSQTPKPTCCMIPFIRYPEKGKFTGTKNRPAVARTRDGGRANYKGE